MRFDEATEMYMARLLDEAPPLDPEQAALIVRAFANTAAAPAALDAA